MFEGASFGGAQCLGRAMSITWRQCEFNSEHRQQRLKEIQGYEWVLILSWLSALLLWGLHGGLLSDSFAVLSNLFSTCRGHCHDYRRLLFRRN
jgi:hypothetical protein